MSLLSITNLSLSINGTPILRDVSLSVNTGEIVAYGRCTTVYFDLAKREKKLLPDDIRAGLEALLINED